ncbi:MAG: DUF1330 domain-containing protein [Dehalococcoidales bacterium]|nr:MAG: DUF1330 domain-containing protein [Dehalococcoidales bacterium]
MPAYPIANFKVLDQQKYYEYVQAGGETIVQYGGKLLAFSADSKVIKGNPNPVTVVVEFESMEAFQRWYDSPEYTKAKKIRQQPGVLEGCSVLVPQYEMQ